MSNPIPESVTKAQVDAALEALGIPEHVGLVSLAIFPHYVSVSRWVRDESGRPIGDGPVRIEIPVDRGRHPDEATLADDPTEPLDGGRIDADLTSEEWS